MSCPSSTKAEGAHTARTGAGPRPGVHNSQGAWTPAARDAGQFSRTPKGRPLEGHTASQGHRVPGPYTTEPFPPREGGLWPPWTWVPWKPQKFYSPSYNNPNCGRISFYSPLYNYSNRGWIGPTQNAKQAGLYPRDLTPTARRSATPHCLCQHRVFAGPCRGLSWNPGTR